MFLLIFCLGMIGAGGFSTQYIKQINEATTSITIQGEPFDMDKIKEGKTALVKTVLSDYVITDIQTTSIGSDAIIVCYESKPLVCLFWIGGFGLLGSLLLIIIRHGTTDWHIS